MFWTQLTAVAGVLIEAVISLFPLADAATVTQIATQWTQFRSSLSAVDYLFPTSFFFALVSSVFIIEGSIFTFKVVRYVLSHITLGLVK